MGEIVNTIFEINSRQEKKRFTRLRTVRLMTNDSNGGIFASQVIRLTGNIYSQMRIYICQERPLSYLRRH